MKEILIATSNKYKQKRLSEIVEGFYAPLKIDILEPVVEVGQTFREIAENKAVEYSKIHNCLTISTDGGAVIPALSKWEPLRTRRFGNTDEERIHSLLEMMKDIPDRTLEWHEALAIAENGKLLFSLQVRAMDAVVSHEVDPKKYEEGIWLCSVSDFPQFGGKNYFDLTEEEKRATEDSWTKLKQGFIEYMSGVK